MALAINIEDLLNKQKIESSRIEFKKGRNLANIYNMLGYNSCFFRLIAHIFRNFSVCLN